ncbi:hypothetical protein LSO9J_40057 [Candidatus Liberibacter solanacearum]
MIGFIVEYEYNFKTSIMAFPLSFNRLSINETKEKSVATSNTVETVAYLIS